MDQYAAENAREKIAGYMVSRHPCESTEAYFARAKAECLRHMKNATADIEAMSFESFIASAKQKNAAIKSATGQ